MFVQLFADIHIFWWINALVLRPQWFGEVESSENGNPSRRGAQQKKLTLNPDVQVARDGYQPGLVQGVTKSWRVPLSFQTGQKPCRYSDAHRRRRANIRRGKIDALKSVLA